MSVISKAASILLQSIARRFLSKRRYQRTLRSIVKIQCVYRRFTARKTFFLFMSAIMNIQRVAMGRIARIRVRKLKNPYSKLDYYKLVEMIKSVDKEIKNSFDKKEFSLCTEMESNRYDMWKILSVLPLVIDHIILFIIFLFLQPEREGNNRVVINRIINEIDFAIEYYSDKGDDASKTQLEVRLASVEKKRILFPNAEELALQLEMKKKELDTAMAKKEFKKCREVQQQIDELTKVNKRLESESSSPLNALPLVDLKLQRTNLETQMTSALANKDFDLCARLQSDMDLLIECINRRDLSSEDVTKRRECIIAEMDNSFEIKDFYGMALLQEELEYLDSLNLSNNSFEGKSLDELKTLERILLSELSTTDCNLESEKCDKLRDELSSLQSFINALSPSEEVQLTGLSN